ncbi:glycosyltransferase family 39 protein [Planctomyces sp. SH-PL62]|uniref:glycosyltransferase family 39 protein n=1 Tax=Planctomyces sp. SH-PL62 TaxID=1636152 RepID=UPI00078C9180|nr:glycosyltransferase family 39 protein [Planctomyces sp. SH-PL62]AMV37147.1 Undecaprenyl phosphate-alpha-4-amino-4-deoxy-L-arabinose arabinosyl transferase [Planctomyces sp. SH-PL62]
MTPKHATLLLIATSTSLRLLAAFSLGLGNDEAYHFLYAMHPAPSYFDHPPMVAWVEMLGLRVVGDAFSTFGLRLGFVALFAGSTWLMARIAGRWFGGWAGFFAALALNLSGYYGLAVGTFALPDGPLLFFWLLTLDRLDLALEEPGRLRPWAGVGLAWGLAMLSKYHAIFLPAGAALYILASPTRRRLLKAPGPYLAAVLGILVFGPVLVWNVRNGWASFAFQGSRAVGVAFRPDCLLGAIAAQAAYLFPWIWAPLVVVGWKVARSWKDRDEHERLAFCLCVAPLAMFTAVACVRPVLPHWGLVGMLPLFPSLGRALAVRAHADPSRTRRRVAFAAGFSVLMLGLTISEYHLGWLQRRPEGGAGVLTAKTDPTAELYGWDQVAERLDRLGLLDDPRTFLFTKNWYQSAQIAHATAMRRPVHCYNLEDARGFAFWSDPAGAVGRDGVMLMINDDYTPFSFYEHWFRSAEALDDFTVLRAGKPVRRVRIFRLNEQLTAFPLRYTAEDAAKRIKLRERLQGHAVSYSPPPEVGEKRPTTRRD